MKTTKCILALALILMLTLSLSAPAFADGPQYKATKDYIDLCSTVDGLDCRYDGVVQFYGSDNERVTVDYKGDLSDYISHFSVLFNEEGDEIFLYMPRVITFDADDLDNVLVDVNELNAESAGVKLYVDQSDNSVTAELYLLATEDTAGEIGAVGTGVLIGFTDSIFDLLSSYNTAA